MYILPVPHKMTLSEGSFILKYDTEIMLSANCTFQELHYAKLLQEDVKRILSFDLPLHKAFQTAADCIFLSIDSRLKEQNYTLSVTPEGVRITGGDTSGLLFGVQTLRQILGQAGAVLPCMEVEDGPDMPARGFYHDVTRGRIPTLEALKALADRVSLYKMNQLQLYVEHSFLFKDFSEVWRDDTPLTAEEILELDEYCRKLNIELVPSIASFGHLHKVLTTKTYAHLCELENSREEPFTFFRRMNHHTLDVTNEESFAFVRKMLLEFMPLFSSDKFNICADETFDLGKGKSRALAEQKGVDGVYVDFVNKVCSVVKEYGKQPMFWGDIIVGSPERIKELPKDILCLTWGYGANESENSSRLMHEAGAAQYICPGVHGWRQFLNRNDYAYENISRMCSYAFKYNAVGILNTDWGDYGHINFIRASTPGMIYGAAFSWNKQQLDFDTINRMVSVVAYGDRTEAFAGLVSSMAQCQLFSWEKAVRYQEAHIDRLSDKEIKEFFQEIPLENAAQKNEELSGLVSRLYGVMLSMEESKRELVKEYLVMAKGIQIFNIIGEILQSVKYGGVEKPEQTPDDAAVALEYWWKDYKAIWRAQGRESELFRIQDVVFWCADLMRSL